MRYWTLRDWLGVLGLTALILWLLFSWYSCASFDANCHSKGGVVSGGNRYQGGDRICSDREGKVTDVK